MQQQRDIAAVVHTHPVHATMFAVCRRPIPCAIEELELYVGGDVPVAAYHKTGTAALGELSTACTTRRAPKSSRGFGIFSRRLT